MLDIDEIKSRLKDRNLSEVARRTGVSYGTLYNFTRDVKSPLYSTVKALSDYLEKGEG